ncbi:MAG TPA: hypothetical protein VFX35_04545 [Solirubrobacterales bacterium]|nr:hypothetical protein [Solirubrobacterales bacterium]
MKRFAALCALVLSLALTLASSASAENVWGSDGCLKPEWKPSTIVLACGDGKVVFETEGWDVWNSDEATASGLLKHPDIYAQSCANRPIYACPWVETIATVRLSAPAYCPSTRHRQFLRLRLDAPEDRDPELRKVDHRFACGQYPPVKPPRRRHAYWRDCGYPAAYAPQSVIAHRVNCAKARRVIRKVWRLGQESGEVAVLHVKSFDCVLVGGSRPISCKRGSHKIRGPLPG